MIEVKNIKPNSTADKLGLEADDRILAVNDKEIKDYIDYNNAVADFQFKLKVKKQNGNIIEYEVERKYEEFIPWWEENWQLGVPSWHQGKVDYDTWRGASYGVDRLRGMVNFMKSEDWSQRMPEMKEYIELIDRTRDLKFAEVFPEMKDIFR